MAVPNPEAYPTPPLVDCGEVTCTPSTDPDSCRCAIVCNNIEIAFNQFNAAGQTAADVLSEEQIKAVWGRLHLTSADDADAEKKDA